MISLSNMLILIKNIHEIIWICTRKYAHTRKFNVKASFSAQIRTTHMCVYSIKSLKQFWTNRNSLYKIRIAMRQVFLCSWPNAHSTSLPISRYISDLIIISLTEHMHRMQTKQIDINTHIVNRRVFERKVVNM